MATKRRKVPLQLALIVETDSLRDFARLHARRAAQNCRNPTTRVGNPVLIDSFRRERHRAKERIRSVARIQARMLNDDRDVRLDQR